MNEGNKKMKLGLVLSGGGAKGAYEVGVLKALAKHNIEPDVISGASIGAINGCIIASTPRFSEAIEKLELVWRGIDKEKIFKFRVMESNYEALPALHHAMYSSMDEMVPATQKSVNPLIKEGQKYFSLLDSAPLEKIVTEVIDLDFLLSENSKKFYVSVYPASNSPFEVVDDLIHWIISDKNSEFLCIKDFPKEQIVKLVLASAALLIAYEPVDIDGKIYRDGGIGNRVTAQGNTPAEPLEKEGCTHAIIPILGDGVLWNRNEWSFTSIEIRPWSSLEEQGWIKSLLDFSPNNIDKLIKLGESDAERSLGKVIEASRAISNYRLSNLKLAHQISLLKSQDQEFDKSP